MSTEKTAEKPEVRKASMLGTATIYLRQEITADQLDAVQLLAAEFGLTVGPVQFDDQVVGDGITTNTMSVDDCNTLAAKLAEAGVEFTSVLDVTVPVPDEPFLLIHLAGAGKRTLRRIEALVRWIDENDPSSIIGSITDLPNSRPEDGTQIEFTGGKSNE